jgi:biopolymer transport protein ExbD
MKPRAIEDTIDLPDLTPMIDIVFLLIVFFMTVAKMQVQQMVPISVPIAEAAMIPEDRGARMTVTLKNDGSIFFGPQAVILEDIAPLIAQGNATQSGLKVYIRADAMVPFKEVRKVFAAAAEGGVPNVVFATFQSDK